jgi:hypothetical protein
VLPSRESDAGEDGKKVKKRGTKKKVDFLSKADLAYIFSQNQTSSVSRGAQGTMSSGSPFVTSSEVGKQTKVPKEKRRVSSVVRFFSLSILKRHISTLLSLIESGAGW